jgi:hypothetical protein
MDLHATNNNALKRVQNTSAVKKEKKRTQGGEVRAKRWVARVTVVGYNLELKDAPWRHMT